MGEQSGVASIINRGHDFVGLLPIVWNNWIVSSLVLGDGGGVDDVCEELASHVVSCVGAATFDLLANFQRLSHCTVSM